MSEELKRGSHGGAARAQKLSKEQRSAIATAAAQRRWGKKKSEEPPVSKDLTDFIDVAVDGIKKQIDEAIALAEPAKDNHCPACVAGQDFAQGTHVAGSLEHPFTSVPAQIVNIPPTFVEPPPTPKLVNRKPKPMPKEFKSASSYAEKRLPIAIKEKSEHVGAVAKLDAEINDLVRVIKALGGTVDAQVAQPYPQNYYPNTTIPPYQIPQGQPAIDTGIDPNLYTTNAGPLPGTPAIPIQRIPNTSLGGAMDLDYVPRDDEEERRNKLPDMGKGWV
jgi:hypothetical protein